MRRLPVYLVIDTSYSMRGEPIDSVKNGIRQMIETLRRNPYALETVFLSIITYDTLAVQIIPLTELYMFQFVNFEAKGKSALGSALKLIKERIENEYIKSTFESKGDWKPIVFLMADGGSSDSWKNAAKDFKKLNLGMFICCAAGKNANLSVLKSLCEIVVHMDNLNEDKIIGFFQWVSASIAATSKKIEVSNDQTIIFSELPPLPKEIFLT